MSLEAPGTKRRVALDHTQYFKTNHIVTIFIRGCFPRMLAKFIHWPILKGKMQNSVQTHIEALGSWADHAFAWLFHSRADGTVRIPF